MKKMSAVFFIISILCALGNGIIPVREFPKRLFGEVGVTINPTVNQCAAAGYRIINDPPPAESGKVLVSRTYIQDPENKEKAISVDVYEDAPVYAIPEKPLDLQAAENDLINAITDVNKTHSLGLVVTDGYKKMHSKIKESTTVERIDKIEIGLELNTLLNAVLYHGGALTNLEFHAEGSK